MAPTAELAVIGGTGFPALWEGAEELRTVTPHGPVSDVITFGEAAGRRVAYLARHGRQHQHPPHQIPYLANLWALVDMGVSQILAPTWCGALRPDLADGALVLPDQLVDRTHGRTKSFFLAGTSHTAFAEPYCARGRAAVLDTAREQGIEVVDGGTLVVVEGPRFPTRAETRWYAAAGGTVVNMTGQPEASLAREMRMCYTTIGLVVNVDAALAGGSGADPAAVFRTLEERAERVRQLVLATLATLPADRPCPCGTNSGLVLSTEPRLWI